MFQNRVLQQTYLVFSLGQIFGSRPKKNSLDFMVQKTVVRVLHIHGYVNITKQRMKIKARKSNHCKVYILFFAEQSMSYNIYYKLKNCNALWYLKVDLMIMFTVISELTSQLKFYCKYF